MSDEENTPRTKEAMKQKQREFWGAYPVPVDTVSAEFAKSLEVENNQLRKVLSKLVEFDDLMNDEEWEECCTYSGAYHAYFKGKYDIWQEARKLLNQEKQ